MEKANTHIELVTGMIKKMYTTDGIQVMSIDEIKNGCGYVVVSNNDPFIKTKYDKMDLTRRPGTSYKGLQGHTLTNEFLERIRPITKRGKREEAKDDSKPIWGGGKRAQTSKPVQTPSTPAAATTKKQIVVSDGMETSASTEFTEPEIRNDEYTSIPENRSNKSMQRVATVEPDEESEAEVPVQTKSSPKTAGRAKTAAARPKTTAAKFEQEQEESLPPLIREASVKSK